MYIYISLYIYITDPPMADLAVLLECRIALQKKTSETQSFVWTHRKKCRPLRYTEPLQQYGIVWGQSKQEGLYCLLYAQLCASVSPPITKWQGPDMSSDPIWYVCIIQTGIGDRRCCMRCQRTAFSRFLLGSHIWQLHGLFLKSPSST